MEKGEEKRTEGFLGGLRDFLKMLEDMEKKGESTRTVSGEIEAPGYSRIAYDYSVTLGMGKEDFLHSRKVLKPRPRPGKGIRNSTNDLMQRKPLMDAFDKGDHVMVVAELPNVKEEDIALEVVGNVLKISAKTPRGRFERDIRVPEGSEVEKILEASFKNGVLEIRLSKRGGGLDG